MAFGALRSSRKDGGVALCGRAGWRNVAAIRPRRRGQDVQPALAALLAGGAAMLELSVWALGVPARTAAAMLSAMQPRTASAEDRTMLFMMRRKGEIGGVVRRNDSDRLSDWKGRRTVCTNKPRFCCQPVHVFSQPAAMNADQAAGSVSLQTVSGLPPMPGIARPASVRQ